MAKNKITGEFAKALKKARDRILEEPKRLDMSLFIERPEDEEAAPACNTVGCIAGWARLSSFKVREIKTMTGVQLHDLDRSADRWFIGQIEKEFGVGPIAAADVASTIFSVENWPDRVKTAYNNAKTQRGRARATAQRIDHFIKTGL